MPFYSKGRSVAVTCQTCGESFYVFAGAVEKGAHKYCSRACYAVAQRGPRIDYACAHCAAPLTGTPSRSLKKRYCSEKCRSAAFRIKFRTRVVQTCLVCGTRFYANPARVNHGGAKFCSQKCAGTRLKERPPRQGAVLDRSRPALIYQALNLVNGKRYLGVTSQGLHARRRSHLTAAKRGVNTVLAKAIRKYGSDQLRFSVLKHCADMSEAFTEEQRLIGLWQPEYNLSGGGEGLVGYRHTEEQLRARATRPSALKGRKRDPELVARIGMKLRGKKHRLSPEAIEKRRQQAADMRQRPKRPHSKARRDFASELGRARRRSVQCLDDGRVFESAKAATEFYGLHKGAVSAVAAGSRKTVGGKRFSYVGPE